MLNRKTRYRIVLIGDFISLKDCARFCHPIQALLEKNLCEIDLDIENVNRYSWNFASSLEGDIHKINLRGGSVRLIGGENNIKDFLEVLGFGRYFHGG